MQDTQRGMDMPTTNKEIALPEEIIEDIVRVYRFDKERRPQDRAHDYLKDRRVSRSFDDTAIQATCLDLCRRSYAAGFARAASDGAAGDLPRFASAMRRLADAMDKKALDA